jgi:hypothetical protein
VSRTRTREKVLLSILVVGLLSSLSALGVFGLFAAVTQSNGNEITTGTVSFTDNDSGAALYNAAGLKPGDSVTKCIKATYTGTLRADVRLYSASVPGPLAQYIDLTITQGTQASSTVPDCSGFQANGGAIFTGTLQSLEQTRGSYGAGITTAPVSKSAWDSGDAVVYRVQAVLRSDMPDSAQGATSGPHAFTWEARSQ